MPIMTQNSKAKLMCGGKKVVKMYCQGDVIYSSGNICTYIVRGAKYTQEYEEGQSVLSPSVVKPSLSGATFLGWSISASSTSVVNSLVMGDEPITLYAVFKYANLTIINSSTLYTLENDSTKTIYTLGSNYDSYTITAKVDSFGVANATIGRVTAFVYIGNTKVRSRYSDRAEAVSKEQTGYIGTNGITFTLTGTGNVIIKKENVSGEVYVYVYSLVANGKTVVG